MRRLPSYFLFTLILTIFALFLLWPIYQVLRSAFFGVPFSPTGAAFTLGYFKEIFLNDDLFSGLTNSAAIAICTTILATAIATPLAVLTVRYNFPAKQQLSALLLIPLILPPFVGAIGMRQLFGRFGALTGLLQQLAIIPQTSPIDWLGHARFLGIVIVEALSLYPILYLNLSAALANIAPALE